MLEWQPTAEISTLKARAEFLRSIRQFFFERKVIEVEVPLLAQHGVTDPYNENFALSFFDKSYYLQTSPEYHLKRLLAAGMPDCYQLAKAFRYEASGKHHNPEFTMLEWYRLNWTYHQLIEEVIALIHQSIGPLDVKKFSYQSLFQTFCSLNPLDCSLAELAQFGKAKNLGVNDVEGLTKDDWLNLIMSFLIEPKLPSNTLVVIYDYPKSQAALAIQDGEIAKRFEVYLNGIELANGFEELTDHQQQLARFKQDNTQRRQNNQAIKTIDPFFIAALQHGLPPCSGVALGIDRLIMAKLGRDNIADVISFTSNNA